MVRALRMTPTQLSAMLSGAQFPAVWLMTITNRRKTAMRNKRLLRTLSAFCLTMVVAFGFTIPAFAQGSEQAPAAPAEDSTNDSNVIVEETEPAPALTPRGMRHWWMILEEISSLLLLRPKLEITFTS